MPPLRNYRVAIGYINCKLIMHVFKLISALVLTNQVQIGINVNKWTNGSQHMETKNHGVNDLFISCGMIVTADTELAS